MTLSHPQHKFYLCPSLGKSKRLLFFQHTPFLIKEIWRKAMNVKLLWRKKMRQGCIGFMSSLFKKLSGQVCPTSCPNSDIDNKFRRCVKIFCIFLLISTLPSTIGCADALVCFTMQLGVATVKSFYSLCLGGGLLQTSALCWNSEILEMLEEQLILRQEKWAWIDKPTFPGKFN